MKMSDKDFDQLFNTKLGDIEAEPSPMVWDNITAELNGKVKKEMMVIPFIRIAASIVVLMGVSLFFMRPEVQNVALHGSNNNVAEIEQLPLKPTNKATIIPATNMMEDSSSKAVATVNRRGYVPAVVLIKEIKNAVDTAQILAEVNKKLADNAKANTIALQQQDAQQAIITNNTISQQSKTIAPEKQAILANNNPILQKAEGTVKKKRIHSLGDLLNVVIAQVDKRKDKIVEFTNDRDNDSFNITGINLGVISAKKDK